MKYKRKIGVTGFVAVLLAMVLSAVPAAGAVNNGTVYPVLTNEIQGWPAGPEVACETAVLMDADSGNVLYNKGMNELRYPASITKVMTALLAIENLSPDQQVTFSETSVQAIAVSGSSNMGMQAGETITVRDCLYGLLIESANEAAVQLAETVSGTEAAFADLMNQRASQIGCADTHFANASGLPDENHYTTAYDMALIFREALKNETFREIIGTQSYTIPATNLNPNPKELHTHHPLLASETPEHYEGCIGGKSGNTEAAGKTLVTAAERDGVTYIVVVMKGADMGTNCADTTALFNYGYDNFQKLELTDGYVIVPKGVTLEQLESTEEVQEDGRTLLRYTYGGQSVGSAYKEEPREEEPEEIPEEQNEAEENAENKDVEQDDGSSVNMLSMVTILLICMCVLIIITIILLIALIHKDKKRRKKRKKKRKKN